MTLRKLKLWGTLNGMKEAEEILSVKADGYHSKSDKFPSLLFVHSKKSSNFA